MANMQPTPEQQKYLDLFKQNAMLMQENERLRGALADVLRKSHTDDPAWGIAQIALMPCDFCKYPFDQALLGKEGCPDCGGLPLPGQHAREEPGYNHSTI